MQPDFDAEVELIELPYEASPDAFDDANLVWPANYQWRGGSTHEGIKETIELIVRKVPRLKRADREAVKQCAEVIVLNLAVSVACRKWLRLPGSTSSYSTGSRLHGLGLSHQIVQDIVHALVAEGLVEFKKGYEQHRTTNRIFPTPMLQEHLEGGYEFVHVQWSMRHLVQIRDSRDSDRTNQIQRKLPRDHQDLSRLTFINKRNRDPSVSFPLKAPMTMIFSQGIINGGRIYTPCQNLPKKIRLSSLIDGEEVVEIDFKASQLRIVAATRDIELPADPYEGLSSDRAMSKSVVMKVLGNCKRSKLDHSIRQSAYDYWRDRGIGQEKHEEVVERFQKTLMAVEARYPFLFDTYLAEDSTNTSWRGDGLWCQMYEGRIMLRVVHQCALKDITAVPIHDSILVQARHADLVEKLMREAFKAELDTNVQPVLDLNAKTSH